MYLLSFLLLITTFLTANISYYAVNMDTGEVIADHQSNQSFLPGSCLKIVTTGAALNLLDPASRFHTDLEYDGFIDERGTLQGNLYIHGGGDPCLGSERIASNPSLKEQLSIWIEAVQKLGIKKIRGSVIGDATRWEKAMAVPSWLFEDLANYYGAGACALSFHENFYSLYLNPGSKANTNCEILFTDPPLSKLFIHNELTTGPINSGDRAFLYGCEYSWVQFLRGSIPLGQTPFIIKGAIPDPPTFCADSLKNALLSKGIFIEDKPLQKSKRVVFHTTLSPTIEEIIFWTNQKSINLYAEHLLKKMGEVVYAEGSTDAGLKAVTSFWKSQGIDIEGFNMADGSGVSRKNFITAKQLVAILTKMRKSSALHKSLPHQNELISSKTGSMTTLRCSIGYKGSIAFAIMINNSLDPNKKAIIDQFVEKL